MIRQYGMAAATGMAAADVSLLYRLTTIRSVYRAVRRVLGLRGEAIHQLTDGERVTIAWLREEGLF